MKITIAGDSWGCGEWSELERWEDHLGNNPDADSLKKDVDHPYGVSHLGLEQYLVDDGYEVTNLSEGGGTNLSTLNNLKSHLKERQDYIFIFVTDTTRQFEHRNQFWRKKFKYKDYVERHRVLLRNFINELDSLDFGPIYLIGGLSKLDNILTKYTKINVIVPSMLELVIPDSTQFEFHFEKHIGGKSFYSPKDITYYLSKQLGNELYKQQMSWEYFREHPAMLKDHPTRESHKILYDYIKENLLD